LENPSDLLRLKQLIISRAVETKSEGFVLASGKRSNLYIDLRRITQDPEGINLVGKLVLSKVHELSPDAKFVGGMETGAIPITTAVCLLSQNTPKPLRAFWVRKKQKDHGLQNMIEGNLEKGGSVVILEDTVTTGGSSLQAAAEVKNFGARVVQAIAVVDRGGKLNFERDGIPFFSLLSESDLVS
jgi:orotate phosphoribosyltransferase